MDEPEPAGVALRGAVDSLPEYVDSFIKNAQITSSLVQTQERNGKIRLPRIMLNVLLWRFCDRLPVKGYRLIKRSSRPRFLVQVLKGNTKIRVDHRPERVSRLSGLYGFPLDIHSTLQQHDTPCAQRQVSRGG